MIENKEEKGEGSERRSSGKAGHKDKESGKEKKAHLKSTRNIMKCISWMSKMKMSRTLPMSTKRTKVKEKNAEHIYSQEILSNSASSIERGSFYTFLKGHMKSAVDR